MANFEEAFARTEKFEGKNIWTKTEGDAGGETWSGISRVANPTWAGWKIIDGIPNKKHGQAFSTPELERLKRELYKNNYWNTVWGDRINNQKVAEDMYDTGVNMGVATSIKLSERQWGLTETGKMSEALLSKLNSVV